MSLDIIFSFILVCGGVFFAAHAPLFRRKAILPVGIVWALVWVAYNLTWLSFSPHLLVGIQYTAYWSILDLLLGAYIAEKAIHYGWGLLLFILSSLQICCHITHAYGWWDFQFYSSILDYLFYIQAMVFILNGASGIGNRIFNITSFMRHGMDKNKAV